MFKGIRITYAMAITRLRQVGSTMFVQKIRYHWSRAQNPSGDYHWSQAQSGGKHHWSQAHRP